MSGDRLQGRVAVVTGAARNIGFAIARRFAAEGARVVLADIDEESVVAATDRITAAGGDALAVQADVGDSRSVDRLFDAVVAAHGGVDVLVNNAGIVASSMRHVFDADESWWDQVINTNLKGHFLCSVRAARIMAAAGGGVIITTSSVGATRAHRAMVAYDASKGGIEAMTRALALDLAPYGIRVVGIVPGSVPSRDAAADNGPPAADQTVPLQRGGTPDDIAGPALFLASEDAAYMTGTLIHVDGGMMAQQRPPQVELFPLDRFPKVAQGPVVDSDQA